MQGGLRHILGGFDDNSEITSVSGSHWAQGYKKNFMLNSAEHEILNAHKHKISRYSAVFRLR